MPTNPENILDRWRRINMFSSAEVLKLANDACAYIAGGNAQVETLITDHMLEVLRRLVQQKREAEIRFKVIRDPHSRHDQSTIQAQVFIDGKERGGYGAKVLDPAIPEGVQGALHKFMHTLAHDLGKIGID